MCAESAAVSRDLPIPGSPEISTTRPSPLFACSQRRRSNSISSSRPTRAVTPRAQGLEAAHLAELSPKTPPRRVAARPKPSSCSAQGPQDQKARQSAGGCSRRSPRVFGVAMVCSRAARFGVSPTTPRSCAAPSPIRSPTTTSPVAIPSGYCRASRAGFGYRRDQLQPGPHRLLGIVLMRLRISEINQHAVAHIFGDKAVKAATVSATQW